MTINRDVPKDTGWSWLVMMCAMLNVLFSNGMVSSYGILLVGVEQYYQTTSSAVATILGTLMMTRGIGGALILNSLPKYFEMRTIIMTGAAVNSLAFVMSSLAPNVHFLIFSAGFLSGISGACLYGPSIVLASNYFDKRRGFANTIVLTGSNIGQMILPAIYLWLLGTYGITGTYLVMGGILLNCVALGAIMRPKSFYVRNAAENPLSAERKRLWHHILTALKKVKEKFTHEKGTTKENVNSCNSLLPENRPFVGRYYSYSIQDFNDNDEESDVNDTGEGFELLYLFENEYGDVFTLRGVDDEDGDRSSYADTLDNMGSTDDMDSENKAEKKTLINTKTAPNYGTTSIAVISVLTNKVAVMTLIALSLNSCGSQSQWAFLPFRTAELGISEENTAVIYSVTGIVMLSSKPLFGLISDLKCVKRQYLIAGCVICVSAITMCVPILTTFPHMLAFATIIGIFGGTMKCSAAILLLEELGIDLLPCALSIDILSKGITTALTQTFLGWLRDVTGELTIGYFVMGGMELTAVILLLGSTLMKKYQHS